MNILYLAHRIPYPPDKGDKIRAYHTIRHLAGKHRLWCACFVDDPADYQHVSKLRGMCEDVIVLPLRRLRASISAVLNLAIDESASDGYYRDPAMIRALTQLNDRVHFDAVLAFSSTMAQYAELIDANRRLIDLCDLDSRKWADYAKQSTAPRAWLYRTESNRLAQRERDIARQFDATILISQEEANDFAIGRHSEPQAQAWGQNEFSEPQAQAWGQKISNNTTGEFHNPIAIIGNGVTPPPAGALGGYDQQTVGFVGDMSYAPNEDAVRWFANSIWPRVRSRHPDAKFKIVGRSPSPPVMRLNERDGVEVTGSVKNIMAELATFQCAVAPLRIARGVQNKVLEAMAAARPVIATSNAARGIEATEGQHLLIGDTPVAFADHITRLLADSNLCQQLGSAARAHVERIYPWNRQLQPLDALLTNPSHRRKPMDRATPSKVLSPDLRPVL